jgi:copper(I)-binding protein
MLNVLVVADAAGSGTVIATLVNSDLVNDDALTGVTGSGESEEATFEVAGSVDIPAGGLVNLAEEGPISVDPADELVPGLLIPVTFEFERSAQVTLQVPIVEQTDEGPYADVPVS